MVLQYQVGDATRPSGTDPKVIVHICNDLGGWGAGFVMALSRRWREPEEAYSRWVLGSEPTPFELGQVQFVQVEPDLWVANMIAQQNTVRRLNEPPIRYDAVRECLTKVVDFAKEHGASVHMPRIGSGIAGGDWTKIARIIEDTVVAAGVPVTVYDLPGR